MGVVARIAREARFLTGLGRTLWAIRKIDPAGDVLITDDFEAAVDRYADHTAVLFEGQTWTYRQIEALSNRFAAWAEAQGLKRGDTVAVLLPNRAEYSACWMGLAKRGVAAALINTNLTGAALAHCLSISNAAHIITDTSLVPAFDTIRVQMPRPLTLWVLDASADLAPDRRAFDLKTPAARPDRAVRQGIHARDTALYIFTSGTTGMPKAAKISHARAQLYMRAFAAATATTSEDRIYCALPLYHSTGGLCAVGAATLHGATLVLRRRFSATHFWDDVVEQDCDVFVYIGELCRYLVNQPPHPRERAHRLRLGFGNGMRPEVWTAFQERFAVKNILEFYGSTEGNVSLFNFDGRPGSVGRVPPYLKQTFPVRLAKFDVEAEQPVRGADGFCIECDVGDIGEAIGRIANDNYSGYADQKSSEQKVLRNVFETGDAWFRTGDLMRQDRDGYFYFVDRIGDTYRWKGENVSTTEVAGALSHYPGVGEVNVYGVSVNGLDGRAGMAAVTPIDGFDLSGLWPFVERELPAYARPLFIRIDPAIETTGTFKYRKVDLVKDGFDPARVEHALYFADPATQRYQPITPELYNAIQSGTLRL